MQKNNTIILVLAILIFAIVANRCKVEDEKNQEVIVFDQNVKNIADKVNADSLQKKVEWLENMGSRFALKIDRKEVAKKIRDRFISYGYDNATLDSFNISLSKWGQTYDTWQYNVIAKLVGSNSPDLVYIIGGHYDSIIEDNRAFTNAPGANDNASGVAATLEVARILKDQGFRPLSTIEFIAFSSEEFGLYGSFDYVVKAFQSYKDIKLMLNNDMIAYCPNGAIKMQVNILDYYNSTEIRVKAQQYCKLYTSLSTVNNNYYNRYSDSYSFFEKNYRAIYFTTNYSYPYYHSVNDRSTNCNFEICKEITKVNCAILVDYNKQ